MGSLLGSCLRSLPKALKNKRDLLKEAHLICCRIFHLKHSNRCYESTNVLDQLNDAPESLSYNDQLHTHPAVLAIESNSSYFFGLEGK